MRTRALNGLGDHRDGGDVDESMLSDVEDPHVASERYAAGDAGGLCFSVNFIDLPGNPP